MAFIGFRILGTWNDKVCKGRKANLYVRTHLLKFMTNVTYNFDA